jgi:ABC-type lipoprotein release transport system permease subunit
MIVALLTLVALLTVYIPVPRAFKMDTAKALHYEYS